MNIMYASQAVAESIKLRREDFVISITEPGRRANLMLEDPLNVLRLQFDDHDPHDNTNLLMPEYAWDDQVLFTHEQANQIIDFVEKHKEEAKMFYVHCWAGISRSRAVVMAIREFYGVDMNPTQQWDSANKYVYRIMNEALTGHKVGSCFGEADE